MRLRRGCRGCQGQKEFSTWDNVNGQFVKLTAPCEICDGKGYIELSLLKTILSLPQILVARFRWRRGIREGMQAWEENTNGKMAVSTHLNRPRKNEC